MTGKHAKGKAKEREYAELLKAKFGFTDVFVPAMSKWQNKGETGSNDIFGVFDIIAIHPKIGILFVQVTTRGGGASHERMIDEFMAAYPKIAKYDETKPDDHPIRQRDWEAWLVDYQTGKPGFRIRKVW